MHGPMNVKFEHTNLVVIKLRITLIGLLLKPTTFQFYVSVLINSLSSKDKLTSCYNKIPSIFSARNFFPKNYKTWRSVTISRLLLLNFLDQGTENVCWIHSVCFNFRQSFSCPQIFSELLPIHTQNSCISSRKAFDIIDQFYTKMGMADIC